MITIVSDNLWVGGGLLILAGFAYMLVELCSAALKVASEQRARDQLAEQLDIQIQRARKQQQAESSESLSWFGARKFVVVKTEYESLDRQIRSFYLRPHDEKPIPAFEPGQFLTFELQPPGDMGTVKRCYSLSDAPRDGVYRVTVKRCPPPPDQPDAPPGVSSSYFHDHVTEGDILDVRAPSGKFFLDTVSDRPIVLIGGGVGLTPLLSMLNTTLEFGGDREVWFFYGVRNGAEHAMKAHLRAASIAHSNLHLHVCYSDPAEGDVAGEDYDHESRVGVPVLQSVLPSNNFQYLICGPPPMMESLISALEEWGVPKQDILREGFGPTTGRKAAAMAIDPEAAGPQGVFKRSGKTARWDPAFESLVKFAEANGCNIPYACLAGNCGTCLTTVISGQVDYQGNEPDFDAEGGTCLPCSCVPESALELDA